MFATILMFLGLAPAGADLNPCLMPAWAVFSKPQAIACDVKDAAAGAKDTVAGQRTPELFKRSQPNRLGYVLVYATSSSGDDADTAAVLAGAEGGRVVAQGRIASPLNTWESTLTGFGLSFDAAPVGAVVLLVPPAGAKASQTR